MPITKPMPIIETRAKTDAYHLNTGQKPMPIPHSGGVRGGYPPGERRRSRSEYARSECERQTERERERDGERERAKTDAYNITKPMPII